MKDASMSQEKIGAYLKENRFHTLHSKELALVFKYISNSKLSAHYFFLVNFPLRPCFFGVFFLNKCFLGCRLRI